VQRDEVRVRDARGRARLVDFGLADASAPPKGARITASTNPGKRRASATNTPITSRASTAVPLIAKT